MFFFFAFVYRKGSFSPLTNDTGILFSVAGFRLEVLVWSSQVLNYLEMDKPVDGSPKPFIISLLPFTDSSLRFPLAAALYGIPCALYQGKWYLHYVSQPMEGMERCIFFFLISKSDLESDF